MWSYWPTLGNLVDTWLRVADYSHGFLVLPLALLILWSWRASCPGIANSSPVLALGLLGVSLALRHAGDVFFFTFLDGWSIVPWVASLTALVGGVPLLRWAAPAIVFLLFMVPLPFALEQELSGPLQRIATLISTAALQILGQPALSEGNVIVLGDTRLEVAQACSGLRLFVGIVALTYAYIAIAGRSWCDKLLLAAAAVPVAIGANSARIVVTGLLYQTASSEQSRQWIHEGAGIGMVLFAAAALWLVLAYVRVLVKEEQVMDMNAVVKQFRG